MSALANRIFFAMKEKPSSDSRTLPPAEVDVAVLILFFNRPECLSEVFEQVRKAKPSKLFLYQDGPRGEQDIKGIMECRKVVENIDWECDLHRNYREKNEGVDPANYNAQAWAFSIVDKCIVFEDDSIPTPSFIRFCKEMLDRYEHDERIGMIAGFNTDEITKDVEDDYFFTSVFSIWGWASWRRVISKWDETYSFLEDDCTMIKLNGIMRQRQLCKDTLRSCYNHKASPVNYYETLFWSTMVLNSYMAIMPAKNMVNNLGPMAGSSTHFSAALETLPKSQRHLFTMKRYDLDFPLKHPQYVIEHVPYKERNFKINAYGHPWIKMSRSFEELFLNLIHGNFGNIRKAIGNRFAKLTGLYDYK